MISHFRNYINAFKFNNFEKQIVENNSESHCIKEPEDMLGGEIDMCEHAERVWLKGTTAG